MSSNNYWLYNQLRDKNIQLTAGPEPLIEANTIIGNLKIYTPTPAEYVITMEIVDKVLELGGNTISYPTNWCKASSESISYGREVGIQVMPHGKLLCRI